MSGLVDFALARRRDVLLATLALAALIAPGLLRLGTDNSPPVWFLAGSREVAEYRRFTSVFGGDEGFRVALSGPAVWTRAGVAYLARLEREAAGLAGVREVWSVVSHHRPELAGAPAEHPDELRALARDNALDRAMGWITADGLSVSLLIESESLDRAAEARLSAALERLTAAPPPGLEVTSFGTRSLELALDDSSREVGRRFLPLLVLVAALVLGVSFRGAAAVAVPLAHVALSTAAVAGAMGWAGVRLNLVLAILPPLVVVVALASALHVLIPVRAQAASGVPMVEAVRQVYREKGRALVWTGVTTAAGFAALAASPVPPVRALGLWAGGGLALETLGLFLWYPALLAAAGARRALPERALEARMERFGRGFARAAGRRRGLVLGLYGASALVCALGLGRLERQSDAFTYLPPSHPVRQAAERLEARGLGVSTLELVLIAPAGESFAEPGALVRLAELARRLRALPGVLGGAGAGDLAADLGASSPLAALATPEELAGQGLALAEAVPEGRRALARFLSADRRQARLTLFVAHGGYEAIDRLAAAIGEEAGRLLPAGTGIHVTGLLRVLLALHRYLLTTLAGSLALMLPVLALTFFVLLGSVRDTLRALVPNLWPVLALLGGMGWLGVPLDVATAMVASIVLGLVVDDTIHTLAHYRERSRQVGGFEAVADRLERATPAYLLTGGILSAGFGVCALSSFEPIARFGALSAATIVIAVAADLLLVPALFARDGAVRPFAAGATREAPSSASSTT